MDGRTSGAANEQLPVPWTLRPDGRNRWSLFRDERYVAELGMLMTGEWWACPAGEALPWPDTYASRGAVARTVVIWWIRTREAPRGRRPGR